jgi:hypothetical protein
MAEAEAEVVEEVKFEDIEKILQELTESLSMAHERTSLLGKRIRSEVEEEDLKAALRLIEALEKSYLATPQPQDQCWFEYVTLQAGHKN